MVVLARILLIDRVEIVGTVIALVQDKGQFYHVAGWGAWLMLELIMLAAMGAFKFNFAIST